MNKKLIISLSTIAAIAIIAIGATTAYFSNTETSSGNTFIAGAIDLKIDNECHLNGRVCIDGHWQGTDEPCDCTWGLMDLDGKAIFHFTDVKPGDDGEDTISLHVDSNPAWVCAEVSNVQQNENGCNVPEDIVDETCGTPGPNEGELWGVLKFSLWMDNGAGENACNNIKDSDETYLIENAGASNIKWPIADSQTGGGPIRDACIGVSWSVPDGVGNIIQGDSVTGDITFNAYQARNNDNFLCNPPVGPFCGNDIVETPETCELPDTINNPFCGQSTSECVGPKLQTRDGYGDCGLTCGCVEDPWGPLTCDKQTCKAACESDVDCPTNYTCNTNTCSCEYVPSCGNGIKDEGEQCDDGNNEDNDGCSATCQSEPAYVVIHKDVVNNGVGTKTSGDFKMTLDDVLTAQDTPINMGNINNHVVSEQDTFGYIKTYSNDCDASGNITTAWNQTKTCTVTNTMPYGTITVTKEVKNDNGGTLTVASFTLKIDAVTVSSGVAKNVTVGTHTVSEVGQFGYSATFSGDCDSSGHVTVAAGENKYCTITNDDIAPSIELVKIVSGGSADPDDFDLSIDGNIVTSGSSNPVLANTAHALDEEVIVGGYTFTSMTGTSFKGVSCPSVLNGTITLVPGDVVTCTITNTY
jgi:predicted ribosomally synthesized peptide with SipW-like signal peptide